MKKKIILLFFSLAIQTFVLAQTEKVEITGTVTDASGIPLPGVNILVEDTKTGTLTNFDGTYSISTSKEKTLIFSYLGFETLKVTIGSETTINATLKETLSELNEVVVVGFGTTTKGALTSAISQIDADELTISNPVSNPVTVLQGALPGLVVTRQSSQPGSEGIGIQIRGASSVNAGNSPLVLIDGVEGSIGLLNADDIDTFTVLKDASAAIYGSRASNGVILVTTKNGKLGKPTFEINSSITYQTPQDLWDQMSVTQYAELHREAEMNEGQATPSWFPNIYYDKLIAGTGVQGEDNWAQNINNPNQRRMFYEDSDLEDNLIANSFSSNYSFAVSGGDNKSRYRFSLGYNRDEGFFAIKNNVSDRYNAKLSYQWDISDRLNIDAKVGIERVEVDEPTSTFEIMERFEKANPIQPTYNAEGGYLTWGGFINPVQVLDEGGRRDRRNTNVRVNLTSTLKLFKGLKFVNQTAVNILNTDLEVTNETFPMLHWTGSQFGTQNTPNNVTFSHAETFYKNMSNYFEYKTKLNNDHSISATVGNVYEGTKNQAFNATAQSIVSSELFHLSLGDPDTKENTSSAYERVLISYFGRLSYNYKNKYFIEAVGRRDGSSRFSPENRWGNYGGISAAWALNKEDFIDNLNVFDNLRLSFSIGETGNDRIATNYNFIQTINVGSQVLFGAGGIESRASLNNPPAVDATWEIILNKNIALDFAFFNHRLSGRVDVYNKTNTNMLISENFSEILGATPPRVNAGELKVDGYEIELNWQDKIGDFGYNVGVRFWDSKNKVTKVGSNVAKQVGINANYLGLPINSYLGYQSAGIIKTPEQLEAYSQLENTPAQLDIGDVMWEDLDGNGSIDPFGDDGESGDLHNFGSTDPRYNYGFNFGINWKNFDLGVYGTGVGKRVLVASNRALPYEGSRARWHKPNAYYHNWGYTEEFVDDTTGRVIVEARDTNNPRITLGPTATWNWRHGTYRSWNGAYLRIKNIALGYTIPKDLTRKIGIDNLRLYVNASDVFTFDKVPGGFDPEYGTANQGRFPLSKNYIFGVQVKF